MSSRSVWRSTAAACGIASMVLVVQAFAASGYRILKKFPIPTDEATWDYITVDEAGRRLFVCQETQIHVLHADTGKILGKIPDLKGAHITVLVPEVKHGFITNGVSATVTMFDFDTLKKLKEIPTGGLADAMAYDPFSKRVFSMNTVGRNTTVINVADGTVAGNIDLDGKPEQAVADGVGHVFVPIKDKNVVVRIDSHKLAVDRRWPAGGCDRPTSTAMDRKNHRLFVGCRDLMMYVMDSDSGRVITSLPIGDNVDNTAFDPVTGLIFTSSEDGLLAIMHEDGPDSYRLVETLKTLPGSKTMALDLSTHTIFLPYGEVEKLPPVKQPKSGGKVDMSGVRRRVIANSFGVLVVGK
jgi:hypothetical protein